jgi:hypothetical protein
MNHKWRNQTNHETEMKIYDDKDEQNTLTNEKTL